MTRAALRRLLPALLGLAAGAAHAAEPAPPLEATKRELRQLQESEKDKTRPTAREGLKVDASTYQLNPSDAETPQQWLTEKLRQERAKEQKGAARQRNWLADGVHRLEEKAGGTEATGKTEPGERKDETALVDRDDPQYLLNLFESQKKPEPRDDAARATRGRGPDPFAPFLQGWLGNSPVRAQLSDILGKPESNPAAPAAGLPPGVPVIASGTIGGLPAAAPTAVESRPKPNPFLAGLEPAPAPPGALPDATALNAPVPATAPAVVVPLEPVPLPAPGLETRAPLHSPPPGPADERKYFPQLKKF